MTLLDALRILELAPPLTPEGVDRAGHEAMRRLEETVRCSPTDAELAARALASAGEVRAAYAFLRELPAHLYPYCVVAPPAGVEAPPLVFPAPAPLPEAAATGVEQAGWAAPPAQPSCPFAELATSWTHTTAGSQKDCDAMPIVTGSASATGALPGAVPAVQLAWETETRARSTPPQTGYPAPSVLRPPESSRRFPNGRSFLAWSALIIALGVSTWYCIMCFYPSGKPAPDDGSSLSSQQPGQPASGGSPRMKPSEAAALRGASPNDAFSENGSAGSPSRRMVVKTAPDGSVVANMPDGSTMRQTPGGNRHYTYGPKGSPFGNGSSTSRVPDAAVADAEAQYLLAKKLISPPSPPSDTPAGLRLLEKAAAQNHLMAGYTLACTYLDGIGRPADPQKGVSMLRSLTEGRTFPMAAIRLADCHRDGLGVDCDYKYALSVYQHWQSLPSAQYRISLMYQHGCGVGKDDAEALKWLQLAVAADHPPALYQMGLRYTKGQGAPQDDVQAAEVYALAAKFDYAPAQAALGRCYQDGRGVPFTAGLAIHYFQQAAVQGFPHAQDYLGSCYAQGNCIWKDAKQAAGWYGRAAAQGHGPAQMHLGRFLMEDHSGLPADPVRALAWFIRAQSQDEEGAAEMVSHAREQLSPQDIAAAELIASELPRTPAWNQWQPLSP